jgi:2-oxo-4-hydroxy-4-carboxy-5-ureidoimidazoline decarboxylase
MNLEELNSAASEITESHFKDCCGSRRWAQKMTKARPFGDFSELLEKAENIWKNLETKDRLEAFAAHPKIGAKRSAPSQQAQAAAWSGGEQSGMQAANDATKDALAEANRLYEEKFGFIFIVCATGKSAREMLEICRARLENSLDEEMRIAAEEQRKITEIRLKKLLNSEPRTE